MKSAPNLKKQPRDKMTEVIIFAGSDAWSHAKEWQEWAGKHIAADDVPPVVLADEQLKNITDYRIIDEDRQCVRVYRAGHITEHWNIKPQNIITQSGGAEWSGKDKETFDPNDDIESYAEFSEGVTNIIIMGGNVWKKYRSFRAIKEALDTRRGSNAELETALKDLGDSVSFKGYMGDVAIVVYSGRYTDEDGTEKHFLDPDLMVLGNTALQGIVAYGGIQDPELIRMGLTKAELAPKNYIVPGDPAIEYVQTHSAPQPIPARINRFVTVRIG